jgi:hypothetical protein
MPIKTQHLVLVATLAGAIPAAAQMPPQQIPPCGPRVAVIEQLERDFSETPTSRGLASNGTVLELLVSPAGTWTMLISLPNGHSCFGAAGEMWEEAPGMEGGASPVARGRPAKFNFSN